MIVKAAIVSDIRDWPIGFNEEAGSGGESRLHDELVGSDSEDALDEAGKADAVGFEIFQGAGEAGWDAFAIAGRAQIS